MNLSSINNIILWTISSKGQELNAGRYMQYDEMPINNAKWIIVLSVYQSFIYTQLNVLQYCIRGKKHSIFIQDHVWLKQRGHFVIIWLWWFWGCLFDIMWRLYFCAIVTLDNCLTHWGRYKMAANFLMTISNTFSRIKVYLFSNKSISISIKISLKLVPKAPINNIPA